MIRIGLIDGGVDGKKLSKHVNLESYIVSGEDVINNWLVNNEHGTTCAQLIDYYVTYFSNRNHKQEEVTINLISICVFEEGQVLSEASKVITALKWCYENNIELIHMSIGTSYYKDIMAIRPILNKLTHNGQIVVAAYSNITQMSLPLCIHGLLGVKVDVSLPPYSWRVDENGVIHAASHCLINKNQNSEACNSYAAPLISALAYWYAWEKYPFGMDAIEVFRKLSKGCVSIPCNPFCGEEAVLINLSKDNINCNLLSFKCSEILTSLSEVVCHDRFHKSIVILPSDDSELNERVLQNVDKKLATCFEIIYCGMIPNTLIWMRKKRLIWDESLSLEFTNTKVLEDFSDCPIVWIKCNDLKDLLLALDLERFFKTKGYESICLSDWQYGYLFGAIYLSDVKLISKIQSFCQPDLIIFCINGMSEVKCSNEDLFIELESSSKVEEVFRQILSFYE